MKKTVKLSDFRLILVMTIFAFACIVFIGNVRTKAATEENAGEIRVSGPKELKKAMDDPAITTIYFSSNKRINMTIKANANAKNKTLYINAPYVNINNKAAFAAILVSSVCDYVENTSGNNILLYSPSNIHSFTVAKNKTVNSLSLLTISTFDDSYSKYVLRKGAKINSVYAGYYVEGGEVKVIGDYDKSKKEISIKYTNDSGEPYSYLFKLDERGRIINMVSEETFKFDYTFTYDKDGRRIKAAGYDEDEGNVVNDITYSETGCIDILESDAIKLDQYFIFDEKGRTIGIKEITTVDGVKDIKYHSYTYDSKDRIITETYDNGENSYKITYTNFYNSKDLLEKYVTSYFTADGKPDGEPLLTTYKYDKAGNIQSKTVSCGNAQTITEFAYDQHGYYLGEYETTFNEQGLTEISLTEEELKALNHETFLANQKEAILKRHKSMSATFDNIYPNMAEAAKYYYVTSDGLYEEAPYWMEYYTDRVTYQLMGLGDPENAYAMYIIGLEKDWDSKLWNPLPADESIWMDYDRETLIGVYVGDGKIHLISEYNDEYSKEHCENTGLKYKGQRFTTEAIFDENTLDYLGLITREVLDGKSEIVGTQVFEYDVPEPSSYLLLRSMFERTDVKMIKATITIDPDTKNEISKSIIIPANSNIAYSVEDYDNIELFEDRKCTIPRTKPWDKVSDFEMYIKTIK